MSARHYSPLDQLIMNLDQAIRTVAGRPLITDRPNPANETPDAELSETARDQSARLMRINHAGEVAAQALYQGQALTARLGDVKARMEQAAREENDHLDWCEKRIKELGGHTSLLNPLWYAGSFTIGATAGAIGDKWSLGFVAETEKQVTRHLEEHLAQISPDDRKSRAILEQMKEDEIHHGKAAKAAGGVDLPAPVRGLMKLVSKVMTTAAYRV